MSALKLKLRVTQRKLAEHYMRTAYRLVGTIAADRGWTIAQTQAAIWCGICKANGVRPGSFADSVAALSQISFEF